MEVIDTAVIRLRTRWWLMPYLRTLALLCWVFDAEPNWKHVEYWVVKSIYLPKSGI